ncbi:hypothetical protein JKP88DRAFT_310185, partial [Tribonema minus]
QQQLAGKPHQHDPVFSRSNKADLGGTSATAGQESHQGRGATGERGPRPSSVDITPPSAASAAGLMSPPGVYAAGDWRSDAHLADRRTIVATIETLLPIPGRCKSEWDAKKRTRAMARRLEEGLYAQAVSFEEYNDLDTLHRRVQDMATAIAQAKRTAQGEVPPPPPPVAGRGADQSPAQTTAESPHSIRGTVDSAEWEAHHEAIVAASALLSSPPAPTAEQQQEEHTYGRMDDTDASISSRHLRGDAVAGDGAGAQRARARAAAAAAAAARTSRLREASAAAALTDDNDDASFWHMSDATSDAPQGAALAVSDAARSDSTPHTLSPLAAEARWASGSSGGPGGAQSDEGGSGGGSAAARSSLSPPPRSAAAAAAGAAALSAEEGCGAAAAAAAPTHQRHTSDATVDTDASYYDTLDEADRMLSESDMVSAAGTVHTSATAATVRASVPPPYAATAAAALAPPAAALSPASAQAASIEAASAEAASVATALAPAATAASLMAPLAKASAGPRPVSTVARPRSVSTAAASAPRSSLLPAAAAAATGTVAAAAPRTAAAAPLVLRTAAAEAAAPRPAAAAVAAPRPASAPRPAPLRRPPMVEPAGPAPLAEEQWRSEAHAAHRKRMVARILELLTSSGKRQGPEWRRKNRVMARRLEDALYTDAAAFAEYDDDATLAARLHAVAMQFTSDAARAKRMSDRARAAVIAANEPRAKPAAAPHKAAKAAQSAEAAAAAAAAAPHQRSPNARPSSAPQPSLHRSPRPVLTAAAAAAAEAAAQQRSAAAAPPQQTAAQALRPVPAPHHTVVPEPPTWHATARKAAAAAAAGARPRASSSAAAAAAAPSVAPLTHVERRRAGLTLRSDSLDSSVQSGSSFGSPLADVSPSNWSSLRAIAAEFPAVPGGSIRP